MKKVFAFSMATAACWLIPAGILHAAIPPFSQYGQIQNVQSYSSNPFYNPDSPYNQRLPKPIYAQGTELNAGECRSVVDSIIAEQCALKNNCDGLNYSDISPAIIIQLSNMTGHNYMSSCGGYVQTAFEDYKKNTGSMAITGFPSAFPKADIQTEKPSSELVLNNPFEIKDPQWQKERDARQKELRDLQKQNGSDDVALEATKFPTTYADLSFTERMANDKAGYEPWKDASGYKIIKVEDDEKRNTRETAIATQQLELAKKQKEILQFENHKEWCEKYPSDCLKENEAAIKSACAGWVASGMPEPAPVINDTKLSASICTEAVSAKAQSDAAAAAEKKAEEDKVKKEKEEKDEEEGFIINLKPL